MNGDIPAAVWGLLDISSRPYETLALRDDGKSLFAESDFDLRSATEQEIESSGLMRHPMLRFIRLSRVEDGEVKTIVFRIETYHTEAISQASDDFLDIVFETLAQAGFKPFDAGPT